MHPVYSATPPEVTSKSHRISAELSLSVRGGSRLFPELLVDCERRKRSSSSTDDWHSCNFAARQQSKGLTETVLLTTPMVPSSPNLVSKLSIPTRTLCSLPRLPHDFSTYYVASFSLLFLYQRRSFLLLGLLHGHVHQYAKGPLAYYVPSSRLAGASMASLLSIRVAHQDPGSKTEITQGDTGRPGATRCAAESVAMALIWRPCRWIRTEKKEVERRRHWSSRAHAHVRLRPSCGG